MFKKAALSVVFAVVLIFSVFHSNASAASIVYFCTEFNCSSITVTLGGVTHSSKLNCTNVIGFSGVPQGTYSWSASGCGFLGSGAISINGTSNYIITLCPSSQSLCCPSGQGCGTSGSYKCSACGSPTTTTTTTPNTTSTTTTTVPNTTTTTSIIPSTGAALEVRNSNGNPVFTVKDNGSTYTAARLVTNGASAWGSAPFVLGQDVGNRGIVITNKSPNNPKNIYFGWDIGASQQYAEIFALQEGIAFKNLILNPHGGYVGIRTANPSHPLQMGSGAYCSLGGAWTNASSREYKKNIEELASEEAKDTLKYLRPVKFNFKVNPEEQHVGFVAEEAPDLVASKDRKGMSPMDVVAVLTKVVQEQEKLLQEQKKIAEEQQDALRDLTAKVMELQNRLSK